MSAQERGIFDPDTPTPGMFDFAIFDAILNEPVSKLQLTVFVHGNKQIDTLVHGNELIPRSIT